MNDHRDGCFPEANAAADEFPEVTEAARIPPKAERRAQSQKQLSRIYTMMTI